MPESYNSDTLSPYFAAIDLGSNSFHLLIVKYNEGIIETVDRVKDMVQVAKGIRETGQLSKDAKERAIECLSCFQERIRDIPPDQVRVVGTKALRMAKHANQFLKEAESALLHPIDIISGYEEARLVYLGVSHDISADKGQRLIIDIGGGSTEFIIGSHKKPILMESLSIGCVTFTDTFFNNNDDKQSFEARMLDEAYYATSMELELISNAYQKSGWDIAVGSSGTMRAIAELMPNELGSSVITKEHLKNLYDEVKRDLAIPNSSTISLRRKSVLPAGIAILAAIFDELDLEKIHVVDATLKEGLIYDTLGRLSAQDMRDQTVTKLIEQYQIDIEQADRVANTTKFFVEQLNLSPTISGIHPRKILYWAAQLHEIGLSVSHSSHHKHGSYLLTHSDMAGFSRLEQELLALFVGAHRRKLRPEELSLLNLATDSSLNLLLACLRISVILHHRRDDNIDKPSISTQSSEIKLNFPIEWLENHPLTYRKLMQEKKHLESLNLNFVFE